MSEKRKEFSLDAVRTDGWFERIGEGIGSFQALCEIVGERFFAFSIIVGARITALTVDRRSPDQTLVDFVVGVGENDGDLDPQRLTLADFRRRLVGALLVEEDREAPRPDARDRRRSDPALHRRPLPAPRAALRLLAAQARPRREAAASSSSCTTATRRRFDLDTFRMRIRALVREELDRVATGARSAIDLSKVAEAEAAAIRKEWPKVIALLGAWPAPLAIFLRTPEGQMLGADARSLIAKGLGLLGSACVHLGEVEQAEEVFRIGIQYAQEGVAAAELFRRLGEALLLNDRAGEAIGPLRRAARVRRRVVRGHAAARARVPEARAVRRGLRLRARRARRRASPSASWRTRSARWRGRWVRRSRRGARGRSRPKSPARR